MLFNFEFNHGLIPFFLPKFVYFSLNHIYSKLQPFLYSYIQCGAINLSKSS